MTRPVEVYEGDSLLLTRKVTEDRFYLKPTPETADLVGFMAVYWAQRYGISLPAISLLSNHLHQTADDPKGIYPRFLQMFHHWIARVMNMRLGRTGHHFFGPGPPGKTRLLTPEATERKTTYVAANPTLHGIVRHSLEWAGSLWAPDQAGLRKVFRRPPELAQSRVFPPEVELIVPAPATDSNLTATEVRSKYRRLRNAAEAQKARELRRESKRFIGRHRAMKISVRYQPDEPKRGDLNPLFASKDAAALRAAVLTRQSFLKRHRNRLEASRRGERDIVWPPGTYQKFHLQGMPRLTRNGSLQYPPTWESPRPPP